MFSYALDGKLPAGLCLIFIGTEGGAVTEEMVKRYIEDQDDSPQGFKVWDEEPAAPQAEPAFRPIVKPSPLDEGR